MGRHVKCPHCAVSLNNAVDKDEWSVLKAMLCAILPDETYDILRGRSADCARDALGLDRRISTDSVEVEHDSCAVEEDAVFQSALAFRPRIPWRTYYKAATLGKSEVVGGSHLFHLMQSGSDSCQRQSSRSRSSVRVRPAMPLAADFRDNRVQRILSMDFKSKMCSLKLVINLSRPLKEPGSSIRDISTPAGSHGAMSGKSLPL